MLSTKEEAIKYVTNCITGLPVVFIVRPSENAGVQVAMLGITEEQEKQLDNGETLVIETDRGTFNVNPDLCYAYGEFDLSPNSDDIIKMYEAKWFSSFEVRHSVISNYNYENHCGTSDIRVGRWYNTSNLKDYLPYLHACIGKPKRVAIFKEYLNSIVNLKAKREAKKRNNKNYRQNVANNTVKHRDKTIAKRKAKVSSLKFTIKR